MIPKTGKSWRKRYHQSLSLKEKDLSYWSLKNLAEDFQSPLDEQPFVTRLFLENVMRHYEGNEVTPAVIAHFFSAAAWKPETSESAFSFYPSRVLMQDYTGVPAIADLAAMRDAVADAGGTPQMINPVCPVDLVIDHSVIVDQAGADTALSYNRAQEMVRNQERYQFLKWAQQSFDHLTIVPPGRGICHQVNLEYFAQVIRNAEGTLIPDTLVGTDSHTTMINGLGVLGWGVGGIEAEAVMLGQPLSLNMPTIVGVKLEGKLAVGITATDLVLTVTERLRKHGVVGKYVEFYGPGVLCLSVADRATIANMAPEYGATCGLFPIDNKVIEYLTLTNRPTQIVEQVRAYALAQGLWYDNTSPDPLYSENLCIQLGDIVPSVAGPKRPQDRLSLPSIKTKTLEAMALAGHIPPVSDASVAQAAVNEPQPVMDGDIVIAAITSCTNTSNPHVMLLAGLLAKAAVEKGLSVKAHVKTSLAPGSQVVARYLDSLGLQAYLNQLGFQRVGFGCTSCIGNSGPLNPGIEAMVEQGQLNVCAVLSGNRNFEGRVHPAVRLNWLASPPLVIAFALVGHTRIDLVSEPLGNDKQGKAVFLKDIWPSESVVNEALQQVTQAQYTQSYQNMLIGDEAWESLVVEKTLRYHWNEASTYIRKPPFFVGIPNLDGEQNVDRKAKSATIRDAKILAILGDSITTDHISPAGQISINSSAGSYLLSHQIKPDQFNSYGARRGNHEVMVRGTFSNKRLKNKMVSPKEGGFTRVFEEHSFEENEQAHQIVPIYEASQHHMRKGNPLVVFAGKEYGTGSSRDWAAKGCLLLNVKAVIAESYERIHRSNLVGVGILPLQLPSDTRVDDLLLVGDETIDIEWSGELRPSQSVELLIRRKSGEKKAVTVIVRIENNRELEYFHAGGVLPYVANQFSQKALN
jgi:aconitate hydratase